MRLRSNHTCTSFIVILLLVPHISATSFKNVWLEMQKNYNSMCRQLEQHTHIPMKKLLYHPQWRNFSVQIKQLIMGQPDQNFLQFPALTTTMVRSGMGIGQAYESCYLTQCISKKTKKLLSNFAEPSACKLAKECTEFNCSSNALGQLFYAARILEQTSEENLRTIIEFGGGYGCLAHIFRSALPKATIYIIDIPELLAVQYLYLKTALPDEHIHWHTPDNLKSLHKCGIHLIPTHIMHELDLEADLFISNFALSEVTAPVQQMVAEKKFFNANVCYITGQIDGWGNYGFEDHNNVHNHVRSCYDTVMCQPFHLFLATLRSYEMIAWQDL